MSGGTSGGNIYSAAKSAVGVQGTAAAGSWAATLPGKGQHF